MISGGADIATTADIPITLAGLADQEISMIATIEYSNDNIPVIARKDSGISTPGDLIGKTIATTRGGGPLFFAHKYFERHGIRLSDINHVYMNPSDMVNSLIKGDIDAFIVFEPYPYYAENELGSDKTVIFNPDDIYGETWNIVTMKKYESENPEIIDKFLRALVRAEEFLELHPEESILIVSEYSETQPEVLEEMMERQEYGVVITEFMEDLLEDEAQWAMDMDFSKAKSIPDYGKIINPEHLIRIDPKRVN
jgi:ABC-type nitrate/sulfonate/bicarbonate transport system substrate-binding protein